MNRISLAVAIVLAAACALPSTPARADEPQLFTARVDDATFTSDDDGITLVPTGPSFSLSASTAGASAWPPPKTPIDRFSIVCDGFVAGQPFALDAATFARSTCDVTFEKGTRAFPDEPDARFTLDKDATTNRFTVVAASGKVIEGTFVFTLKDDGGKPVAVEGNFKAEDRQY